MAYYNPTTRNGFNMFEMASMLQKAVRRGDFERAGFAAHEMYSHYQKVMWNRMLTISSEDCWGIITKELVVLRAMDESHNAGRAKYDMDPVYVTKAIALLSQAKKSRDACYFACNFILAENPRIPIELDSQYVEKCRAAIERIPDSVFNLEMLDGDAVADLPVLDLAEQFSLMGEAPVREKVLTPDGRDVYKMAALLQKAILVCDMENAGYAANALRTSNRKELWKILLDTAIECGDGSLTKEIIGLKLTDDMVNGRKKPEARDEIFISKAMMLLCYEHTRSYDTLVCNKIVDPVRLVDWSQYELKSIARCKLKDGTIPEWVYDVHTIRGKRAGKTDWGMNIVEQAALNPLQEAFFDHGSWAPRYDFKHKHKMCTEQEYQDSLEYRKTHKANPAERLCEWRWKEAPTPDRLDGFSRSIYNHITGGG